MPKIRPPVFLIDFLFSAFGGIITFFIWAYVYPVLTQRYGPSGIELPIILSVVAWIIISLVWFWLKRLAIRGAEMQRMMPP